MRTTRHWITSRPSCSLHILTKRVGLGNTFRLDASTCRGTWSGHRPGLRLPERQPGHELLTSQTCHLCCTPSHVIDRFRPVRYRIGEARGMKYRTLVTVVAITISSSSFAEDQSAGRSQQPYLPTLADIMGVTQLRHF